MNTFDVGVVVVVVAVDNIDCLTNWQKYIESGIHCNAILCQL
jgi:hypothetical protein